VPLPATRPKANDQDISYPSATPHEIPLNNSTPVPARPHPVRRQFPRPPAAGSPARARLRAPPYSRHPHIHAACQIPVPTRTAKPMNVTLCWLYPLESHTHRFSVHEAVGRLGLEGRCITRGMLSTRLDPDLVAKPDVRCASFSCVAALSQDRDPARNGLRGELHRCLAKVLFARFGGLAGRGGEIPPVR
jgi:hypothetical protein